MKRYICLFFALFCLTATAFAESRDTTYKVVFEGVSSSKVLKTLQLVSDLIRYQNQPPPTVAGLYNRAEGDLEEFRTVLRAYGYYSATVSFEFREEPAPLTIAIKVNEGPPYALMSFRLEPAPDEGPHAVASQAYARTILNEISLRQLDISLHRPLVQEQILDAEILLLNELALKAHPLADVVKRDIVVDPSNYTAAVTLYVNLGPRAKFGRTTIQGLKTVKEKFIHDSLWWKRGQLYSPALINQTYTALEESNLFTTVVIAPGTAVGPDDEIPITITVSEGKQRSVAVGFSYSEYELFGGFLSWENRNIRQLGEKLSISTEITERRQQLTTAYKKPNWRSPRQTLTWQLQAMHERTPAYSQHQDSLGVFIDKRFTYRLRGQLGSTLETLHASRSNNNGRFLLLGVRGELSWSATDDLVDPSQGFRVDLSTRPYLDLYGLKDNFLSQTLSAALFFPFFLITF